MAGDGVQVGDTRTQCPREAPLTLAFSYAIAGSEAPTFVEGVEVEVVQGAVVEPPAPTGPSGTTRVRFATHGDVQLRFKLPEPYVEAKLESDPATYLLLSDEPVESQPIEVSVPAGGKTLFLRLKAACVRFELRDPLGEPVAAEPYQVRFDGGKDDAPIEGSLNERGQASQLVPGDADTECHVAFPHWYAHDFATTPRIAIELRDPLGQAVPDEPFQVLDESGEELHAGTLDEHGRASVEVPDHGRYQVTFPHWYAHDFLGAPKGTT